MSNTVSELLVKEDICNCGHSVEEHYLIDWEEGDEKPTHCEADDCQCELFAYI